MFKVLSKYITQVLNKFSKQTAGQELQEGVIAFKKGKLKRAEYLFRYFLKTQPKHPDVHNYLGVILEKLGRLEEVEESYKEAIGLRNDFFDSYFNLGNTLNKLDRLE